MDFAGFVDDISRQRIIGWALDRDDPQTQVKIRVHVDGHEHGSCITDRARPGLSKHLGIDSNSDHGFIYTFPAPLPSFRPVTIDVVQADGGGPIVGGHKILHAPSNSRASLQPILITSRGRAGTTVLMNWLKQHPGVVLAEEYPFEVELACYYASVLKILITHKLTGSERDPDMVTHATETLQIGRNPWNNPLLLGALGGRELQGLFAESIPDRLASLFRNIILDAYRAIAHKNAKFQARFFAEKCALDEDVRFAIREMLGAVREVVMIRDPRDFLCSAKSFWQFDSERALRVLRATLPEYLKIREAGREDTLIVRYEDLVRDKQNTLLNVADHIKLDSSATGLQDDELFKVHATSKSPEKSVSRWKLDLSPEEIAECLKISGSFMDAFGYAV